MTSSFSGRGTNIPYTLDPATNHSTPPAAGSVPKGTATQDRIVVGVDFGTTYSGRSNVLVGM